MRLPFLRRLVFAANESGNGSPACLVSSGLGSNVLTCDGPPFINRKINRLARGSKCGNLGANGLEASGLGEGLVLSAASKPASESTVDSPTTPRPPPRRSSSWRREMIDAEEREGVIACLVPVVAELSVSRQ